MGEETQRQQAKRDIRLGNEVSSEQIADHSTGLGAKPGAPQRFGQLSSQPAIICELPPDLDVITG